MTGFGLLLGALSAACGGNLDVSYVRTGPPLEQKPDDYPMPVFYNEAPSQPYREVAQLRVRSLDEEATLANVVSAAAQDARELGADAIIVDLRRHHHPVPVGIDCENRAVIQHARRLNARVTAIVWTAPGEASTEPLPSGPPPVDICPPGGRGPG